jgi:2-keto-4-pentenoate hydratase
MGDWDDPRIARGLRAQLELRRKRLAAGDKPLGWKVGYGAPAMLAKFRITGPLVGFLTRNGRIESGGTVSFAGWTRPVAEPEVALHIGKDVGAGVDAATASAAIAGIGPAFELVDVYEPPEDPEVVLSHDIYHRHVVLGPMDASRAGGRSDGLVCKITRRGSEFARITDSQAVTGQWVPIVQHVGNTLAAFGEKLRAGEVIITGSVVPPMPVERDETALGFELEPVGSVSVRLNHG